jgi:hypothetical protein
MKGDIGKMEKTLPIKKMDIFIVRVLIVIIELRLFIHLNNMKYK